MNDLLNSATKGPVVASYRLPGYHTDPRTGRKNLLRRAVMVAGGMHWIVGLQYGESPRIVTPQDETDERWRSYASVNWDDRSELPLRQTVRFTLRSEALDAFKSFLQ